MNRRCYIRQYSTPLVYNFMCTVFVNSYQKYSDRGPSNMPEILVKYVVFALNIFILVTLLLLI